MPLCLALGLLFYCRPDRRLGAAVFLATTWAFVSAGAVNLLAFRLDWWHFGAHGGLFLGVPIDLWLGWSLFWGAVPLLAFGRAPLWLLAVAIGWMDLIVMPRSGSVIELGPSWLLGETLSIATCFVPAQLVGRWTRDNRWLGARVLTQVAMFGALALWLLPSAILEASGRGWPTTLDAPGWAIGVAAQLLAIPAVLGLAAVLEFAQRGRGTPFPWDPPGRLVASGPYAYVANPMALSMTLLLLGLGVLLGSPFVLLGTLVAGAFGSGFARWNEEGDLAARFGPAWHTYRRTVRLWLPRWRPAGLAPGTLYYAESCVECSEVGGWFARRAPIGLALQPAEEYPGPPLVRITYVAADGQAYAGVAALARTLDHLNLAWAWLGWLLRLPGVCWAAQVVVDGVGGEPRAIPSR